MGFSRQLLMWTPRVLGLLFLAVFWTFFIGEGQGEPGGWIAAFSEPLLMRVTIPLVGVTVLVLLALRWSWVGAAAYLLATMYFGYAAFLTHWRGEPPDIRSFCVLAGILLAVAGLFLWDSLKRRSTRAP